MKNNLKKMAKAITLGLVLGTALTAAQPVWAEDPPIIKTGTGTNSIIFNDLTNNKATGAYATAFGEKTKAGSLDGITVGGAGATAWGYNTKAGAITLTSTEVGEGGAYAGRGLTAGTYIGIYATAWGEETLAIGSYSTAFGKNTTASGNSSTAFGEGTFAIGADSVAMGLNSKASGSQSFAMGSGAIASDSAAVAMGSNATASGKYAFVVGYNSEASGMGSVVIGTLAKANSNFSVAIGYNAKAGGQNSLAALGGVTGVWSGDAYTTGTGTNAVAIGVGAVASVDNSVAIGKYAKADTANSTSNNITTTQFAVGGGNDGTNTYYARITGVADGENAHDAVTLGQMKNAVNGLTYDSSTKKISYTTFGNSTATVLVDLSGLGGGDSVVGKAGEISVSEGTGDDAGKKVIGLDSAVKTKLDQVDTNKTNIEALQGVVGDSTSGLVKDVADNKANITSLQGTVGDYSATSGKTYVGKGSVAADLVSLDTAITEFNAQIGNLETTEVVGSGNVTVTKSTQNKKNTYTVALSNNLDLTAAGSVTVGNASINNNGFKVGGTKVTSSGISFEGSAVAVTADGINAGGKKITNVAEGTEDSDAATVGQVNRLIGSAGGAYDELSGQVSRLGTRISKVGAGAAAMASMHPVYDDDSKLSFSAGLGSYRSEKAVAIGAFYRPNERVVVNLGSTMGNDDNMVGLGVNFALDRNVGVKLPSKAVMARELNELREKTAEQDAKIAQLMAMINALKKK